MNYSRKSFLNHLRLNLKVPVNRFLMTNFALNRLKTTYFSTPLSVSSHRESFFSNKRSVYIYWFFYVFTLDAVLISEMMNESVTLAPKCLEARKQQTYNIVNVSFPFSFWSGKPDAVGKLNIHFIYKCNHTQEFS